MAYFCLNVKEVVLIKVLFTVSRLSLWTYVNFGRINGVIKGESKLYKHPTNIIHHQRRESFVMTGIICIKCILSILFSEEHWNWQLFSSSLYFVFLYQILYWLRWQYSVQIEPPYLALDLEFVLFERQTSFCLYGLISCEFYLQLYVLIASADNLWYPLFQLHSISNCL